MPSSAASDSDSEYTVATDGACKGNPGPAGWAWVGEDGEWAAGSVLEGTNNIGELLALLRALQYHADVPRLRVQADSKYAIDTYESWMDGHRRRAWRTSTGAPTKNREILELLIEARDARKAADLPPATLEHVRGHAGHVLNSWADNRAVRASHRAGEGVAHEWATRAGQECVDVSTLPPRSAKDKPKRKR